MKLTQASSYQMNLKIHFGQIFVRVQCIKDPHNQILVRVRTPAPSQD
jgi:hypothetical protein